MADDRPVIPEPRPSHRPSRSGSTSAWTRPRPRPGPPPGSPPTDRHRPASPIWAASWPWPPAGWVASSTTCAPAEREAGDDESTTARSRRDRVLLAAGHLAADLARLSTLTDDEVAWVDGGARAPSLRVSPIDVGPLLAERLWGEVTGVLTSATVPLGLTERLGLPPAQTDVLDVGSPFDYRDHAMLYVAQSLPDRRRPESEPALHDELERLITAAGGRTLALFTSWRAMHAAVEALRNRLSVPVLAQSDLPKPALVEAFRTDEPTCLFATLGFWQGVDVPGRTLSLVTIDRIPFPRPDDPVLQARRDRAGSGRLQLRRPAPGRHAAGPGSRSPHPLGHRPRRGRRARQSPGHRPLPRRPPGPGAADETVGGPVRSRGVPALPGHRGVMPPLR